MVVDPVSSIAFEAEPEEGDVMSRPPRNPKSPLFSVPLILWSLLQGATVLVATAAIFLIAWKRGMPEAEVRSLDVRPPERLGRWRSPRRQMDRRGKPPA